jgi:hypothetical protein
MSRIARPTFAGKSGSNAFARVPDYTAADPAHRDKVLIKKENGAPPVAASPARFLDTDRAATENARPFQRGDVAQLVRARHS